MRKIEHSQRTVWVGKHPTLGAVLYDERCQEGLASDQVRLFKLAERESGTFLKHIVRPALAAPDAADWQAIEPAVDRYLLMHLRQRSTHCYRCRRGLDSVNFNQCLECQWLRCECGACGCGYVHRAGDAEED